MHVVSGFGVVLVGLCQGRIPLKARTGRNSVVLSGHRGAMQGLRYGLRLAAHAASGHRCARRAVASLFVKADLMGVAMSTPASTC